MDAMDDFVSIHPRRDLVRDKPGQKRRKCRGVAPAKLDEVLAPAQVLERLDRGLAYCAGNSIGCAALAA
jgi:hypothetical protein